MSFGWLGGQAETTEVAVVVVTHNTRAEALACLASLGPAGATEVVVVDTGSRDGTARAVREAYPDAKVLELENVGFGRGANAGIRATSAPVVAVSNADVRWDPGSLVTLARIVAADDTIGAVGPAVRYPSGAPQASARRLPTITAAVGHALLSRVQPDNRFTAQYRAADLDPARPRDADWLSGCALALRRDAFDSVGGFDPGYFLFVEDLDLGTRLRAAGWRLRHDPSAGVVHRVGASTSRTPVRARLAHARSLDRYLDQHVLRGPARLLRWPVRVALTLWALVNLLADRFGSRTRSTTGEPIAHGPSPRPTPASEAVPVASRPPASPRTPHEGLA